MPDDAMPTGWEMKRAVESLDRAMRDGLAQINNRLDKLVSQDAFQAEQRRVDDRLKALADDIAEEKALRVSGDKDETQQRILGDEAQQKQLDKLTGLAKWFVAALVVPIVCVLLGWVLSHGGVR